MSLGQTWDVNGIKLRNAKKVRLMDRFKAFIKSTSSIDVRETCQKKMLELRQIRSHFISFKLKGPGQMQLGVGIMDFVFFVSTLR